MTWEILRAAVPTMGVVYLAVREPWARLFLGTVMAAVGAIGLLIALVDHTSEVVPVALAGAGAVLAGVLLVWWGYDRDSVQTTGDATHTP